MKTLELSRADLGYRGTIVLRGVDIKIMEGDTCLINGPNGSGKTTLGLGILGLLRLRRGFRECSFGSLSYVPQTNHLDAQYPLSLESLVSMGVPGYSSPNLFARIGERPIARRLVRDTMERVGLKGKEGNHFIRSSGGELQRALIARALVSAPDIILLDEPFSNIDKTGKREIRELLLREGRERNITLVIIDHHENVDFCSNCLEISEGRVTANGSA